MNFKLTGAVASATHKKNIILDETEIIALSADVTEAVASLEAAHNNFETAERLAQGIVAGLNAAEHIKAVTGDDNVAMVATVASAKIALSNTGLPEGTINNLVTGDDYEAATASVTDVLKNAWETAKEYAKKVWEFIRNLVNSVIDYVMGIFGKGGDSGETLVKLLEGLKKDGKTKLEEDEFSEGTQERIAKQMPYLAANKNVNVDGVVAFIGNVKTILEASNEAKIADKDITTVAVPDTVDVTGLYAAGKAKNDSVFKFVSKLDELYTVIGSNDGQFIGGVEVEETDVITDEIGDHAKVAFKVVANTAKEATVLAFYTTDEGEEALANLKGGKDSEGNAVTDNYKEGELKKLINAVAKGIKVKAVKVTMKVDEALENKEEIKPLDFTDAMKVAKALKDAGKNVEKQIKAYKKVTERAEKDTEKAGKDLGKKVLDAGDGSKGLGLVLTIVEAVNKLKLEVYKETTVGVTRAAQELTNSSATTLIKESARLYTK